MTRSKFSKAKARMTGYRRNRVEGGTYFFTVNLYNRRSALLVQNIEHLRKAVAQTKEKSPFHIDAWVVLPDHLHCLWTLPPGDNGYSMRWRDIKSAFSRLIRRGETRSTSRRERAERGVWQRRFWEHTIRDDQDYAAHMDYIHFNPVKHGLAENASDWTHSSFHRSVRDGFYPIDWAGGTVDLVETGEL